MYTGKKRKQSREAPSVGMKILGALMMTLGALVTGICIALAATTGITFSGEGLTGAGVLAAGMGMFSGGVRSGLSHAMCELANSATAHASPIP